MFSLFFTVACFASVAGFIVAGSADAMAGRRVILCAGFFAIAIVSAIPVFTFAPFGV